MRGGGPAGTVVKVVKVLAVAAGGVLALMWAYLSLLAAYGCETTEAAARTCGTLTPALGAAAGLAGGAGVLAVAVACGLTLRSLDRPGREFRRRIVIACAVAAGCLILQVLLVLALRASRVDAPA